MSAVHASRAVRFLIWAVAWLSLGSLAARAGDWPQYRGPNHDGVSTDRIVKEWPTNGPPEMWRVACTNGLSSFAVSGGRAFTQIRRNVGVADQEVCLALDANTGAELWATTIGPAVYDGGVGYDDGPRSTPGFKDGRVFVLSSYLVLYCLDATNGAVVWRKDLVALYGAQGITWQNAASPLIDNDLIFVNANTAVQSLFALRVGDGSLAWRSENAPLTHSTPVAAAIQGLPQVIFATQAGLISVNRTNGAALWKFPYPFYYNTSLAASPVVNSNIVFISAAYAMGSFATFIAASNTTLVPVLLWTNATLQAHWMTPTARQGFLYGQFGYGGYDSTRAQLKCIDLLTGAERWSTNGFGRGGTILVDDHVLTLTEMGDLVLAKADPAGYTELARCTVFPNYDFDTNKCWNVPAVCDGRVYARSTAEAVCLDISVPPLKMLAPRLQPGNLLELWIGTATGAAIDPSRLAAMEVRFATDPTANLAAWTGLTNTLVLTNGLVRVDQVPARSPSYFVAGENLSPPPLKMLALRLQPENLLELWIGTSTGSAITSNRLAKLEVRCATALAAGPANWTRLTNSLVLTNGVVRVDRIPLRSPSYFVAVETP